MTKVSVIIINWNGKEYLRNCLDSTFKQSYGDFKVVLVDNGSIDGSVEFVRENYPGVEIIALDENYGFAKGNNIGIKHVLWKDSPDYVLLLNNDIRIVQEDCLEKLVEVAENDDEIGILGCKLVYPDGTVQHLGSKSTLSGIYVLTDPEEVSSEPYEVYDVMGAAFLIKKSVIDKIGLLDEGFSPFLCEETDYCIRARKAGYLTKVVPTREVIHYLNKSIDKQSSVYVSLIRKKNSIRFMFLNAPLSKVAYTAFYDFFFYVPSAFFRRRNRDKRITPWNLTVRPNWKNRLNSMRLLFKAYFINMANIKEIIGKRINRAKKLWF